MVQEWPARQGSRWGPKKVGWGPKFPGGGHVPACPHVLYAYGCCPVVDTGNEVFSLRSPPIGEVAVEQRLLANQGGAVICSCHLAGGVGNKTGREGSQMWRKRTDVAEDATLMGSGGNWRRL